MKLSNVNPESVLPPPSEDRLNSEEVYFRIKFPSDYREFLKQHNGATFETGDVRGTRESVEFFLPVLDDYKSHPRGWQDLSVVWSQIEDRLCEESDEYGCRLIPIASAYSGNFFVLDFRDEPSAPSVAFWDHERAEPLKPFTVKVASSFSEFLELLTE